MTLQELEQRNKEMEQQQKGISDTDSRVKKQVQQQQEGISDTDSRVEKQVQQQQQQHVTLAAALLGRGMRTKRPARRCI